MNYFERQGFGASMGEAFWAAYQEAEQQSQTTKTKADLHSSTTFEEVKTPAGVSPLKYAEWIKQAFDSLKTNATEWEKKRYTLFVPQTRQKVVLGLAKKMMNESRVLGLRLMGPAASAYRIKHGIKGKHGKVFLFMGTHIE